MRPVAIATWTPFAAVFLSAARFFSEMPFFASSSVPSISVTIMRIAIRPIPSLAFLKPFLYSLSCHAPSKASGAAM